MMSEASRETSIRPRCRLTNETNLLSSILRQCATGRRKLTSFFVHTSMDSLTIKYKAYAKVLPPQPIRMTNVNWGGSPEKMEDGSEPQPWHCLPFVEGSTYGLELIYPYENECHVVGANGTIHFEWDYANEPGGGLTGGEFVAFSPVDACKYYLFNTRLDIQPPPGYVLRTEPHPRYFTDETRTVPLAIIGNLQNEWYPHLNFAVFRAPEQGRRHIFRKGEPFVQVLFVPHRVKYDIAQMTFEESAERRELEHAIERCKSDIAEHSWHNPTGVGFNNHYKVLARAFARDGIAGVKELVQQAVQRRDSAFPRDKSIAECMALGSHCLKEQLYQQACEIFDHVVERDPENAAAYSALGICYSSMGNLKYALDSMKRAVALRPGSANYHTNLGEFLRRQGHLSEAEASFRSALSLSPSDPEILSVLGLTLAQQGRPTEALQVYEAALATGAPLPPAQLGIGKILAGQGRYAEARARFEAALAIAPTFSPARRALEDLTKREESGVRNQE
jgi:Tfp pilus assembly protein PilF